MLRNPKTKLKISNFIVVEAGLVRPLPLCKMGCFSMPLAISVSSLSKKYRYCVLSEGKNRKIWNFRRKVVLRNLGDVKTFWRQCMCKSRFESCSKYICANSKVHEISELHVMKWTLTNVITICVPISGHV